MNYKDWGVLIITLSPYCILNIRVYLDYEIERGTTMNKRMNIIKVLSLSLMMIFPFPYISAHEAGKTVIKRGAVNDDYYAAGGTVDVNANVAGDITVSGGELFIVKKVHKS